MLSTRAVRRSYKEVVKKRISASCQLKVSCEQAGGWREMAVSLEAQRDDLSTEAEEQSLLEAVSGNH
jgi:hypothetical protein